MFELRPYQQEALAALEKYWSRGGGNPLVVMATATGKSVIIAHLIRDVSQRYPALRVLVVTHTLELVEQDVEHLLALWPDAPIGINSAGIGQREWDAPIIFAGVQSVWRNAGRLGPRHLVLIDEAHLVPHDGDGMYRSLLSELRALAPAGGMRIAGFSATPFRLDSGRLDEGEGKIFDDVVFDYDVGRGIREGWLSPLTSKATKIEINVSNVGRRGGEFIAGELERAADDNAVIAAACDEIVARGVDRRSWLVFCCGVLHAHHVCDALRMRGVACRVVTGETPLTEREDSIAMFKAGMVRCLVNVNVLTTGFDAPRIDLLAMLRPTLSTGLYVQMVGRGTRKADGKVNCLILDFAGNCRTARTGGPGRHQARRQQQRGRRAGHGAHQDLPGLRRDQPARRRGVLLLRLRVAEAEAGGQACDVRRRGPDPHRRAGVAAGHRCQLPPPLQVWRSRRAAVVPGRLSLRPLALRRIRFASSAKATRALAPSAGGTRCQDPRRSRRRWTRRCSASTSSIRWSRSRSRATADSGTSSIVASGARTAASSRLTGTIVAG